jgi:hypothetical protein
MFCPQCGQQQVSVEVRFCSRCGFQLGVVSGLLPTRGALPANFYGASGAESLESPRRRGVRLGVLMFFIGIVLTPLLAIIMGPGVIHDFPQLLIPLSAIIFILGGIVRTLYALVFEEGSLFRKKKADAATTYLPPYAPSQFGQPQASRGAALPDARESIPARSYMSPQAGTSEIVKPPSVTEGTTKLLDDERDVKAR